jgi:ferric-dicitrate binding protein FerR (iron transport regulator)
MNDPFQNDTLLARWLAGSLSAEEERELRAHPEFPAFERLARATDQLRKPTYDAEAEYGKLRPKTAGRPASTRHLRPRPRWKKFVLPAAVVLLLLLALPLLWSDSMTTVVADAGARRSLELAEGTNIILHAGSTLDYSLTRNERQTKLDGEAYFDVARDPDRPFEVITDLGKVTVLGTSFNVSARAAVLRVTCTEGRVSVVPFGRDTAYLLTAGREVEVDPAGLATVATVDTAGALDWLEGRSTFSGARLSEVIREIEEQYGISVRLAPAIDASQRITTQFDHGEPVDNVLQTIFGAIPGTSVERSGEVARVTLER